MINRLQFLHKSELFETREKAIEFLDGLRITRPSLFAEPVVLRYGNEKEPNVILAIGATGSGSTQATLDSSYFMIDAQGIKDDVKNKYDEIEHSLAKLAFTIVDTDTLDLEKVETEDSITLKGNVKVPEKVAIQDKNITNIIKTNKDGLYSYVNLKFDDKTNTFTFQVNENVNTFAIPVIESGRYDISKEAIVFTFTDGKTTEVDVNDLIDEWTTEGDSSKTPIVLTKERHTDKNTNIDDRNGDQWKDVLKADVRIASDKEHNILEKTTDGRNLYVKGTADNIYFKDGKNVKEAIEGIKTEVSSAYTNNIIFKDYANNGGYNGIAANVDVEYKKETNTLVFKHSNNNGDIVSKEFKLNSAAFIDDISYDTVNEKITIRYKDEDGNVHLTDIDLSTLLDDWVTNSDGHNVELNKQIKAGEKDVLTADVKLTDKTNDNYQILEQRDDRLYVKGTADNIHYKGNENVKGALDRLDNSLADEAEKLNKLSGSSYFEVGDTDTVSMRKNADVTSHTVTADVKVSPKGKNTILVDGNNGLYASFDYDAKRNVIIISDTNNDTHQREIQLNSVSTIEYMRYDSAREKIIIGYKSNASSSETKILEIPITDVLKEWGTNNKSHNVRLVKTQHTVDGTDDLSGDVVLATEGNYSDNLIKQVTTTAYDEEMKGLYVSGEEIKTSARGIAKEEANSAADKALVDAKNYTDSVHEIVNSEISVAKENGFNEASAYTDNRLKTYDHNLHDELSILSGNTVTEAVTNSNNNTDAKLERYNDNLHNELSTLSANTVNVALTTASGYTDNKLGRYDHDLHDELSTLSASTVNAAITTASGYTDEKVSDVDTKAQGYASSAETNSKNYADGLRQTSKDEISGLTTNLQKMITSEANERASGITDVNDRVSQETSDRTAADDLINTNLTNEISDRQTADNNLKEKIDKEVSDRTAADSTLQSHIDTEAQNRSNEDSKLNTAISDETTAREQADNSIRTEFKASDTALDNKITAETAARTADTKTLSDKIAKEVTDRTNADATTLQSAKDYSDSKDTDLKTELKTYADDHISAASLNGGATNTAKVTIKDKLVTSDVIVSAMEGNIIKKSEDVAKGGIYANPASLTYQSATNSLTFTDENGVEKIIQLNSASFINSIKKSENGKSIIISYSDTSGGTHTVDISLQDLIDALAVDNIDKTINLSIVKEDRNGISTNVLSAEANIANNTDEVLNLLTTTKKDGKGELLVNGKPIYDAINKVKGNTDSLSGLVKTIIVSVGLNGDGSKKGAGNNIQKELDDTQKGAGLADDGQYIANNSAKYVLSAKSLADADSILDSRLYDLSSITLDLSATTVNQGKDLQEELDAAEIGAFGANTDKSFKYAPIPNSNYINDATSLISADDLLDKAIKKVSGDVTNVKTDNEGINADVKSLQAEIDRIEVGSGLGEQGNYIPSDKPYISDATSLADADKKLADAVASVDKSITNLKQGSKTYSVNVFTEKDNDVSLLKADVRLSVANGQNESELTRTEMPNEGNLLQVVKAKSNGLAIEVGEKINGLYFGGSIDYGMMKGDDTLNG